MSAPTNDRELPGAQAAVANARNALAALHERLNTGDATVTGADLANAEAQLRAAEMLEQGARLRDLARQESENARARADALAAAASANDQTTAAVAAALATARCALGILVDACAAHEDSSRAQLHKVARAAGNDAQLVAHVRQGTVPGVLVAPSVPQDILRALVVEVLRDGGLATGELYEGAAVASLAPFTES